MAKILRVMSASDKVTVKDDVFGNHEVRYLTLGNEKPPMLFSHAPLLRILNHTFWFLPSVASCYAMRNLLGQRNNVFYHDFKIVVAAGTEAGIGVNALPPVRKAMDNPLETRTITLSCGNPTKDDKTENHDKPQTQVDGEEGVNNEGPAEEERFHFIHPEIEDEEAWRIHYAIKRLVANYRIPDICAYLKEQNQKGKLLLPSNPSVMYSELVRLGMSQGEGFSEKNFSNSYIK